MLPAVRCSRATLTTSLGSICRFARQMGKHNHVTTTYHLLVEKKKRSGGSLKAYGQ